MNRYVTVGLVMVAGATLFEAALIPGVVIGGAAVLAPKVLPGLRRRLRPLMNSTAPRRSEPVAWQAGRTEMKVPRSILPQFAFGQAIAKTITFRTIATVMDFTTNYVVVGDVVSAVILSSSGFILGPFVYFGHKKAWDYFTARSERPLDEPTPIKFLPAAA